MQHGGSESGSSPWSLTINKDNVWLYPLFDTWAFHGEKLFEHYPAEKNTLEAAIAALSAKECSEEEDKALDALTREAQRDLFRAYPSPTIDGTMLFDVDQPRLEVPGSQSFHRLKEFATLLALKTDEELTIKFLLCAHQSVMQAGFIVLFMGGFGKREVRLCTHDVITSEERQITYTKTISLFFANQLVVSEKGRGQIYEKIREDDEPLYQLTTTLDVYRKGNEIKHRYQEVYTATDKKILKKFEPIYSPFFILEVVLKNIDDMTENKFRTKIVPIMELLAANDAINGYINIRLMTEFKNSLYLHSDNFRQLQNLNALILIVKLTDKENYLPYLYFLFSFRIENLKPEKIPIYNGNITHIKAFLLTDFSEDVAYDERIKDKKDKLRISVQKYVKKFIVSANASQQDADLALHFDQLLEELTNHHPKIADTLLSDMAINIDAKKNIINYSASVDQILASLGEVADVVDEALLLALEKFRDSVRYFHIKKFIVSANALHKNANLTFRFEQLMEKLNDYPKIKNAILQSMAINIDAKEFYNIINYEESPEKILESLNIDEDEVDAALLQVLADFRDAIYCFVEDNISQFKTSRAICDEYSEYYKKVIEQELKDPPQSLDKVLRSLDNANSLLSKKASPRLKHAAKQYQLIDEMNSKLKDDRFSIYERVHQFSLKRNALGPQLLSVFDEENPRSKNCQVAKKFAQELVNPNKLILSFRILCEEFTDELTNTITEKMQAFALRANYVKPGTEEIDIAKMASDLYRIKPDDQSDDAKTLAAWMPPGLKQDVLRYDLITTNLLRDCLDSDLPTTEKMTEFERQLASVQNNLTDNSESGNRFVRAIKNLLFGDGPFLKRHRLLSFFKPAGQLLMDDFTQLIAARHPVL